MAIVAHEVTTTPTSALSGTAAGVFEIRFHGRRPGHSCRVRAISTQPGADNAGYFTVSSEWTDGVRMNKRRNDQFWVWGDVGGVATITRV